MEAYVRKFVGKKAKLEKLIKKEKGFWIEDFNGFNKRLYKIWACVGELKKGDILIRVCSDNYIVNSDLYVQKPAYVSVKQGYNYVISFDTEAFTRTSEIVRKIFELEAVKLPSLDKFPDNALVQGIQFWDTFPYHHFRNEKILFDGPQTKKRVWEEFKSARQQCFEVQIDYRHNNLRVGLAEVFDNYIGICFTDNKGDSIELDEHNEVKTVKDMVKIIDKIYSDFELLKQKN